MTSYAESSVTCAVCRTVSTQVGLRSTNTLQPPDLDFRPGEMMRSTMHAWVQRCPKCDYCARDLSKASDLASRTVVSDDYRALLRDESYPELARRFLACGLVAELDGELAAAALANHHAAWACDDHGRDNEANTCRTRAIAMLLNAPATTPTRVGDAPAGNDEAILTDLLRRVGRFDEASAVCLRALDRKLDEPVAAALRYQQQLIAARDVGCHTVQEAFQAHAPRLLEPDEARRQALAEAKQVSPAAARIWRGLEKSERTCSHCGKPGRRGLDYYLRRGPQSAVICRRCGSPQS